MFVWAHMIKWCNNLYESWKSKENLKWKFDKVGTRHQGAREVQSISRSFEWLNLCKNIALPQNVNQNVILWIFQVQRVIQYYMICCNCFVHQRFSLGRPLFILHLWTASTMNNLMYYKKWLTALRVLSPSSWRYLVLFSLNKWRRTRNWNKEDITITRHNFRKKKTFVTWSKRFIGDSVSGTGKQLDFFLKAAKSSPLLWLSLALIERSSLNGHYKSTLTRHPRQQQHQDQQQKQKQQQQGQSPSLFLYVFLFFIQAKKTLGSLVLKPIIFRSHHCIKVLYLHLQADLFPILVG